MIRLWTAVLFAALPTITNFAADEPKAPAMVKELRNRVAVDPVTRKA